MSSDRLPIVNSQYQRIRLSMFQDFPEGGESVRIYSGTAVGGAALAVMAAARYTADTTRMLQELHLAADVVRCRMEMCRQEMCIRDRPMRSVICICGRPNNYWIRTALSLIHILQRI